MYQTATGRWTHRFSINGKRITVTEATKEECSEKVAYIKRTQTKPVNRDGVEYIPGTYSVYQHVFPNGKSYVGITAENPQARWKHGHGYKHQQCVFNAIVKYGWANIEHKILYTGLTKEEACFHEERLVRELDLINKANGYNIIEGGVINANHKKKVMCLETGVIYESATEASKSMGFSDHVVMDVYRGKRRVSDGKHFCYLNDMHTIEEIDAKWAETHPKFKAMLEKGILASDGQRLDKRRNKDGKMVFGKPSVDSSSLTSSAINKK